MYFSNKSNLIANEKASNGEIPNSTNQQYYTLIKTKNMLRHRICLHPVYLDKPLFSYTDEDELF